MKMEIYEWVNGQCGELVGPFEGSEYDAIQFCYANWKEYQDHQKAMRDWGDRHYAGETPKWGGGRPPFGILRPDGTWTPFEYMPSSEEEERQEQEEAEAETGKPVVLDDGVSCQRCHSPRVATLSGKCSDMCNFQLGDLDHDGYVPDDVGIGGGDYIELDYCLDCGQIQGKWPLALSPLEKGKTEYA